MRFIKHFAWTLICPAILFGHVVGPDPRYTAAPGDAKFACATAGCHTGPTGEGPINAAGGAVTATFSSGTYTPGVPITITVMVTDPVNRNFGFQMTARLESNLARDQAGDFTAGQNQLVLCDDGSVKTSRGCPSGAKVQFIEHAFASPNSSASTTPYTFTWMPPATNSGPVHFYVAGNAVNNNHTNDSGDHVYTNSYILPPAFQCTNNDKPVITSANSASGFGGGTNFAPGSWLEIKGTNIGATTRQWQGYDFSGANAPTALDGVSVFINGKKGFIYYVSPGQVNVQAPADTSTGPVEVKVTNCNATSDASTVLHEAALVPGMLAPPDSFNIGGKQYLVALYLDGVTYVGNTNLIPGVPFRPAKPGETIVTYGIGFGAVNPSIDPGIVVGVGNQLANPLTIQFGTTAAQVTYYGLAPSQVGVYQFNITVPDVADGDYPITVTVGGVKALPSSMFLTVHR